MNATNYAIAAAAHARWLDIAAGRVIPNRFESEAIEAHVARVPAHRALFDAASYFAARAAEVARAATGGTAGPGADVN